MQKLTHYMNMVNSNGPKGYPGKSQPRPSLPTPSPAPSPRVGRWSLGLRPRRGLLPPQVFWPEGLLDRRGRGENKTPIPKKGLEFNHQPCGTDGSHSFSNVYWLLDTELDIWDTSANKTDKSLCKGCSHANIRQWNINTIRKLKQLEIVPSWTCREGKWGCW